MEIVRERRELAVSHPSLQQWQPYFGVGREWRLGA
jgi:hypothetical protein